MGYIEYVFPDGSTIFGTIPIASWLVDQEGKFAGIMKASGDLTMGSGRFKGIKGTQTMTGKLLKRVQGEIAPKAHNEYTLTFNLSP